ncbi:hypothetical protein B5X24_HaOG210413 [Helicoverpa armigera]|nr:hypothetical protein B5X24_HaOG210413 [Helicoverpa armigera]
MPVLAIEDARTIAFLIKHLVQLQPVEKRTFGTTTTRRQVAYYTPCSEMYLIAPSLELNLSHAALTKRNRVTPYYKDSRSVSYQAVSHEE